MENLIEEKTSGEEQKKISLGEFLKEKRQSLKIEISEASERLRINAKELIALENNEIEKIAKSVFLNGLIKSYAKILGVETKIIEEKIRELHLKSNVENKSHLLVNIGEHTELSPSKDVFFNFLLVSLVLFFLILLVYGSLLKNNKPISTQEIISELEKIKILNDSR